MAFQIFRDNKIVFELIKIRSKDKEAQLWENPLTAFFMELNWLAVLYQAASQFRV